MKRAMIWLVALLFAVYAPVLRAEGKPEGDKPKKVKTKAEFFKSRDKNNDGKVSREEFLHGKKDQKKAERHFVKLDKDKDNFLTLEEFKDGKE
jgi:Ca2+-binding EF-hand superfamily protein